MLKYKFFKLVIGVLLFAQNSFLYSEQENEYVISEKDKGLYTQTIQRIFICGLKDRLEKNRQYILSIKDTCVAHIALNNQNFVSIEKLMIYNQDNKDQVDRYIHNCVREENYEHIEIIEDRIERVEWLVKNF